MMPFNYKKIPLPNHPLARAHVWRYMSFARFHWMLSRRSLWMSRLDLLGDAWEGSLSQHQIEAVLRMRKNDFPGEGPFEAVKSFAGFLGHVHRSTYANCWSQSEAESHAMWKVFCRTSEGVAIRTTMATLHASVGDDYDVLPVRYTHGDDKDGKWDPRWVSTQKRLAFSYENEVRIIRLFERRAADPEPEGIALPWLPSDHIDAIRVHPEADEGFFETVQGAVETLCHTLADRVARSELAQDWMELYSPVAKKVWPNWEEFTSTGEK